MRLISEIFTLPVKVVDGYSSEFDVVHDLSSDGSYCLISELDDKEEAKAIAMALNSYDENQEFIKKQKEQINRFADKVIKQQEQIELLLDGVTHFNRSGGDLNPLLTAYIDIKNNKSKEKVAS
jgi:hypothetical protein